MIGYARRSNVQNKCNIPDNKWLSVNKGRFLRVIYNIKSRDFLHCFFLQKKKKQKQTEFKTYTFGQ